jgi:hypothetical protein
MRQVCCIFLFLISWRVCTAQHLYDSISAKHGQQWVVGYWPAVSFNFTNGIIVIDTIKDANNRVPGGYYCSPNLGGCDICKLDASLATLTSGFIPFDNDGDSVEGGIKCNRLFGDKFLQWSQGNLPQMSIMLPRKGNTYYMFTGGMSDAAYDDADMHFPQRWRMDYLCYHILNMDANNGKGKAESINNVMLQNAYLATNRMTATRHGNGRDWWLIKPHLTKMQFYTFLVTEDAVVLYDSTIVNDSLVGNVWLYGHSAFSPDGTKFAMVTDDYQQRVHLLDFNRCEGKFSNYHAYRVPIDTPQYLWGGPNGVCFSPNNKLLYVTCADRILQYDLSDNNAGSYYQVAGPDTTYNFPYYRIPAVAPDGRLYIGNENGVRMQMSYIEHPDSIGAACQFIPLGVRQEFTNLTGPPNMPNCGLGPWLRSPCDTVYTKLPPLPPAPVPNTWALYPNPTSGSINITVPDSAATSIQTTMYSMLGQKLTTQILPVGAAHTATLDLSNFAKGVYVLEIWHKQQKYTAKVVRE